MIQALTNQEAFGNGSIQMAASDREAIQQLLRSSRIWISAVVAYSKSSMPVIAASAVALLTVVAVASHRAVAPVMGHSLTPTTVRVVVGRGDSLWQLASQYGDPEAAIQDRVDSLARLNGLRAGAPLIAGQRLLVPISNPVELGRHEISLASR